MLKFNIILYITYACAYRTQSIFTAVLCTGKYYLQFKCIICVHTESIFAVALCTVSSTLLLPSTPVVHPLTTC